MPPYVSSRALTPLPFPPMIRVLALLVLAGALSACDTNRDVVPRRAIVTAIQVDDAPLVEPGTGNAWDGSGGGGPEVYFRLFFADEDYVANPGNDLLNPRDDDFAVPTGSPSAWYEDVQGVDFPLVWAIGGGYELDLRDAYRVALFDYDPFDSDDPTIATEEVVLGDFAPEFVDGREQVIVLRGVGADRDLVQVRLRVVFED